MDIRGAIFIKENERKGLNRAREGSRDIEKIERGISYTLLRSKNVRMGEMRGIEATNCKLHGEKDEAIQVQTMTVQWKIRQF